MAAPLAREPDARAQIRVVEAETVAALEVRVGNHVAAQQPVELKVRERLEEDAAAVHDAQPGVADVALERVETIRAAMAVLRLFGRDGVVRANEAHVHGDLPR